MRPKVHAAFVVAGAVFVVLLCTAGVRATPSILIVPLEREFGWSRALVSSVVSLNLVLYGLDWIATVPPTVRLTTEAVGVRDAPIAFGWIVTAHQIGAGVGALGAGVIRSTLTTYTPAWVAAGAICLAAAWVVLGIGRRAPRFSPASVAGGLS